MRVPSTDSRGAAWTDRRVLVTGADGFIGSHLVERLVEAGADVAAICLYNSFDSLGWLDDVAPETMARVEVLRGDVRDAGFVMRALAGRDVVFHLAALISIPHSYSASQSYVETNVGGTLNVLEAARAHRLERVVQTSTSEVYGTARYTPIDEDHPLHGQSPYSASKIGADMMAEAYARSFDLPVVILRPFNTYGPRQSQRAVIPTIVRQLLTPECTDVRLGSLWPQRDFSFVADTVEAFLDIGACSSAEFGVAYNSGSGVAVSIGELSELLREITGSEKAIRTDSERERPPSSEVGCLLASGARLSKATGWRSRVDLRAGLERTVAWWRDDARRSRGGSGATYWV